MPAGSTEKEAWHAYIAVTMAMAWAGVLCAEVVPLQHAWNSEAKLSKLRAIGTVHP